MAVRMELGSTKQAPEQQKQLNELTCELSVLAQHNTLVRGLSEERLQRIASDPTVTSENGDRYQNVGHAADSGARHEKGGNVACSLLKALEATTAFGSERSGGEESSQSGQGEGSGAGQFHTQDAEFDCERVKEMKSSIENEVNNSLEQFRLRCSSHWKEESLDRGVLDVVLDQLKCEDDVVLYRALQHSSSFKENFRKTNSSSYRKRIRKMSACNQYLGTGSEKTFAASMERLLDFTLNKPSFLTALVAVKGLLCVMKHTSEGDLGKPNWDALESAAAGKLEQLALLSIPSPLEGVILLAKRRALTLAFMLGIPSSELVAWLKESNSDPLLIKEVLSYPMTALGSTPRYRVNPFDRKRSGLAVNKLEGESLCGEQALEQVSVDDEWKVDSTTQGSTRKRSTSRYKRKKKARRRKSSVISEPPKIHQTLDDTAAVRDSMRQSRVPSSRAPDVNKSVQVVGALSCIDGVRVDLDQVALEARMRTCIDLTKAEMETTSHPSVSCDECEHPKVLRGIRFKCAYCSNFDLCIFCYKTSSHSQKHPFHAMINQGCISATLPPRDLPMFSFVGIPCVAVTVGEKTPPIGYQVKTLDSPLKSLWVGWMCHGGTKDVASTEERFSGFDVVSRTVIQQGKKVQGISSDVAQCEVGCTVLCWLENNKLFYALNGEKIDVSVDLDTGDSLTPHRSYFPCIRMEAQEAITSMDDYHHVPEHRVTFNIGSVPFEPMNCSVKDLIPAQNYSNASCLVLPQGQKAFAELVSRPDATPYKLEESFVVHALVYWDPEESFKDDGRFYTIFSYVPKVEPNCETISFGITNSGKLYFWRKSKAINYVTMTKYVVMERKVWTTLGVYVNDQAEVQFNIGSVLVEVETYTDNANTRFLGRFHSRRREQRDYNGSRLDSGSSMWLFGAQGVFVDDSEKEILNTFDGAISEIQVFKGKEILPSLQCRLLRLKTFSDTEKAALLFRLRVDEACGKTLYIDDKMYYGSSCTLRGGASMDTAFIYAKTIEVLKLDVSTEQSRQRLSNRLSVVAQGLQNKAAGLGQEKYLVSHVLFKLLSHLARLEEETEFYKGCGWAKPICSAAKIAIDPHVITFLLLHSIIRQCVELWDLGAQTIWALTAAVKLLHANLDELRRIEIPAKSVGLGPSPTGTDSNASRLLKQLLGIVDRNSKCSKSLRADLDGMILSLLSEHVDVFYPSPLSQRSLIMSLTSKRRGEKDVDTELIPRAPCTRTRYFVLLCKVFSQRADLLKKILELGASQFAKNSESHTTNELKWSHAFVAASLASRSTQMSDADTAAAANADMNASNELTKRQVISYIQRIAPQYWLRHNQLDEDEQIVSKRISSKEVAELYLDLKCLIRASEKKAGLSEETESPGSDVSSTDDAHVSQTPAGALELADNLLEATSQGIEKGDSQQYVLALLQSVQRHIFSSPLRNKSVQTPASTYWDDICQQILLHGVEKFIMTEVASTTDQAQTLSETVSSSVGWWENDQSSSILGAVETNLPAPTPLPFDTKFTSRHIVLTRGDSTMEHCKKKTWGSALASQGFPGASGIHKWQVRIHKCHERFAVFVGIALRGARLNADLSREKQSAGVTLGGDVFIDGKLQRRRSFRDKFNSGSIVELTVDTQNFKLSIQDPECSTSPSPLVTLDVTELFSIASAEHVLIYPAVCSFELSDSMSLVSLTKATTPQGHWMINRKRMVNPDVSTLYIYAKSLFHKLTEGPPWTMDSKILASILEGPVAALLLQPLLDGTWGASVYPLALRLLALFQKVESRVSQIQILLSTLIGRLCCNLIVAEDVDVYPVMSTSEELVTRKWCTSPLLSRGLNPAGCSLPSAEVGFIWNSRVKNGDLHEMESHLENQRPLPRVVSDIIHSRRTGKTLLDWVIPHLNQQSIPLIRVGGAQLQTATQAIITALLYHTGWLPIAHRMALSLEKYHMQEPNGLNNDTNGVEQPSLARFGPKPNKRLIDIWQAALNLKAWLVRTEKSSGASDTSIATQVLSVTSFLFDLRPCCILEEPFCNDVLDTFFADVGEHAPKTVSKPREIELAQLSPLPLQRAASNTIKSRLFMGRDLVQATFRTTLHQVTSLLHEVLGGELSIPKLHVRLIARLVAARRRAKGFSQLATVLKQAPMGPGVAPLHCALLTVLPSSLRGWLEGPQIVGNAQWHYLNGLESCNTELLEQVSRSFSNLGDVMASLLQASAASGIPNDFQLVILDAWAIRLEPVDHELLARTHLFETLHRLMEMSRTAEDDQGEDRALARRKYNVGKAATNVFYLLCSQVAVTKSHPVSDRSLKPSLSLRRMRSGPESLNGSVFNLLFAELSYATEQFELEQCGNIDIAALETAQAITPEPGPGFSEEAYLGGSILDKVTSLILSICTENSCQRFLRSKTWLSLLCRVAKISTPHVCCKVFEILRKLLPGQDPYSLQLNLGQNTTMENFLLDLVASVFNSQSNNEIATFRSCEAARTIISLFEESTWRAAIAQEFRQTLDEAASTSLESQQFRALAVCALLSGGIAKLYPGVPVLYVHTENKDSVTFATVSPSVGALNLTRQEYIPIQVEGDDSKLKNVPAEQILPRLWQDWNPCSYLHTLPKLVEAILLFCKHTLSIQSVTKPPTRSYRLNASKARHPVYRKPYVKKKKEIGSLAGGKVINVVQRIGSWVMVETSKSETPPIEAWMILQDSTGEFLMTPKEDDFSTTPRDFAGSIVLGIMAEMSKHPELVPALFKTFTKNSEELPFLANLLEIAGSSIQHGIQDRSRLVERAFLALEEYHHGCNAVKGTSCECGSNSESSRSNNVRTDPKNDEATDESEAESEENVTAGTLREIDSAEVRNAVALIVEMGFPEHWAIHALEQTGDVSSAISFICSNGSNLEEELQSGSEGSERSQGSSEIVNKDEKGDGNGNGATRAECENTEESEGNENQLEGEKEHQLPSGSGKQIQHDGILFSCSGEKEIKNTKRSDFMEEFRIEERAGVFSSKDGHARSNLTFSSSFLNTRYSSDLRARSASPYGRSKSVVFAKQGSLSRSSGELLEEWSLKSWGPYATTRIEYIEALAGYSESELWEELRYVTFCVLVLNARVLLHRLFSNLAQFQPELEIVQRTLSKSNMLRQSTVQFIANTTFEIYPFYGTYALKTLGVANMTPNVRTKLPSQLEPFITSLLASNTEGFADELLRAIECSLLSALGLKDNQDVIERIQCSFLGQSSLMWFAKWSTEALLESRDISRVRKKLVTIWLQVLKAASVSIKTEALQVLDRCLTSISAEQSDDILLQVPFHRLRALTARSLLRESGVKSGYSDFTTGLIEVQGRLASLQKLPLSHNVKDEAKTSVPQKRGTVVSLDSCSSVDLRHVSGSKPPAMEAPWTVNFDIFATKDVSKGSQARLLGAKNSSALQLLTAISTTGEVGVIGKDGVELSFGYRLPKKQWTNIAIVCSYTTRSEQALKQKQNQVATKDQVLSASGQREISDGEEEERRSMKNVHESDDSEDEEEEEEDDDDDDDDDDDKSGAIPESVSSDSMLGDDDGEDDEEEEEDETSSIDADIANMVNLDFIRTHLNMDDEERARRGLEGFSIPKEEQAVLREIMSQYGLDGLDEEMRKGCSSPKMDMNFDAESHEGTDLDEREEDEDDCLRDLDENSESKNKTYAFTSKIDSPSPGPKLSVNPMEPKTAAMGVGLGAGKVKIGLNSPLAAAAATNGSQGFSPGSLGSSGKKGRKRR